LEQAILRGLLATFAEAYAAAWAQIGERMELRLTQLFVGDWTEQAATLFSESGGALLLSHRLQVGDETGVVQWLLPAETLLGFSERQRRTGTMPSATPLSHHVAISLRCGWRGEPIPLRRLPKLQVGDILPLQMPLLIWHGDRPIAIGKPFRKGNRIVVRVMARKQRGKSEGTQPC
jgi:flagellar motor switch protein FliM